MNLTFAKCIKNGLKKKAVVNKQICHHIPTTCITVQTNKLKN